MTRAVYGPIAGILAMAARDLLFHPASAGFLADGANVPLTVACAAQCWRTFARRDRGVATIVAAGRGAPGMAGLIGHRRSRSPACCCAGNEFLAGSRSGLAAISLARGIWNLKWRMILIRKPVSPLFRDHALSAFPAEPRRRSPIRKLHRDHHRDASRANPAMFQVNPGSRRAEATSQCRNMFA